KKYPEAKWHQYEPAMTGASRAGTAQAFGKPFDVHYQFRDALRVLTFDADLFGSGAGHLRYARDFMTRRRDRTRESMNRLYAVESYPTGAGLIADHRLALPPSQIESFIIALAGKLG